MSNRDPHETPMETDLIVLNEKREPWWQKAARAVRAWAEKAFQPVPAEACAACAVKARQVEHWRRVADEHAERHRASEVALEKALRQPAPGTPVLGGEEEGGISFVGLTPSASDRQAERREKYATERVGKPATHQGFPVAPLAPPRPLPPIMRRAVREQRVFRGLGCTRTDGKPAVTTAEIEQKARELVAAREA